MISWALYKKGLGGIWKLMLIFAAVITMYFTIIITMFDPELGTALNEFAKAMPDIMNMVGMSTTDTTMVGFMAAYLYGFIMLVFPMVFSILTANKLVARHVDKGSMAYLLAAPAPRRKVIFTQLKVLGSGIFLLVGYATLVGIVASQALFPGDLDIPKFLLMNLGALVLQLFIGSICFLSSCVFNDVKYSVGFGAGIPALGFIIQMMANAGKELESAKYATFFTLFNPKGIIAGNSGALWDIGILFTGAMLLYCLAMIIFCKRDIPV